MAFGGSDALTKNDDARLKVTPNLLALERGRDELILTDYVDLRPLYVKEGKQYVQGFLKAIGDLRTRGNIVRAFPFDVDLLDTLTAHGIVVTYSFEREKVQNYSAEGADLDHKTNVSLYLLVSQSCNMACVYCLNGSQTYQTDRALKMSSAVAFRSIEQCLSEIAPGGSLEIVFFGGEPLLNWPLVKETVLHCEKSLKRRHPGKEIRYHITSNLSLLPGDLIEWAKWFNITFLCDVDGPAEIHDACRPFKKGAPSHGTITANIRRLVDAGLRVDLRATVTALNHERLLEITRHHKAIGGNSSAFIPVNPVNSDENILGGGLLPSPAKVTEGLIEVYRSGVWDPGQLYPFNLYAPRLRPGAMTVLGCGLPGGNTPVVDAAGDVFPCIYLVGIDRFFMGNMMDGTYPNRALLKGLYDRLHVDRMEDCASCPWRYMCGGGCPLWRLTVSDNPGVTRDTVDYCRDTGCGCTKNLIEVLLWDRAQASASRLMDSLAESPEGTSADGPFC